jgi:hypothetical protein
MVMMMGIGNCVEVAERSCAMTFTDGVQAVKLGRSLVLPPRPWTDSDPQASRLSANFWCRDVGYPGPAGRPSGRMIVDQDTVIGKELEVWMRWRHWTHGSLPQYAEDRFCTEPAGGGVFLADAALPMLAPCDVQHDVPSQREEFSAKVLLELGRFVRFQSLSGCQARYDFH